MTSWLTKSVLAMLTMAPLILAFNFMGRNFGMKPEVIAAAWLFGVVLGIVVSGLQFNLISASDLAISAPLIGVIVAGAVFGTPTNILMAQAIPAAPNPAIPFAIVNAGGIIAFVLAPLLAALLPRYFDAASFGTQQFLGIGLVITGLGLLMYRHA